MTQLTTALLIVTMFTAAAACSQAGSTAIAHRDGLDGLKAFFAEAAAACNAKEFAKGKAIVLAVLPGRDQLRKALKDDADPAVVDKIAAMYARLPSTDEQAACMFTPGEGRTEIKAYASSTEEIRAYAPGTPAFAEFPGGAKTLAERVLRPGVTFYEVEITQPGQDAGVKYHLFFWDGAQWRMLGPAWRVLA